MAPSSLQSPRVSFAAAASEHGRNGSLGSVEFLPPLPPHQRARGGSSSVINAHMPGDADAEQPESRLAACCFPAALTGRSPQGRVTTSCLWHSCRAITLGGMLIVIGITMAILGKTLIGKLLGEGRRGTEWRLDPGIYAYN